MNRNCVYLGVRTRLKDNKIDNKKTIKRLTKCQRFSK